MSPDQNHLTLTELDKEYLKANFVQCSKCIETHDQIDKELANQSKDSALTAQRVGMLCWLTAAETTAIITAVVAAIVRAITN
jgi:hypothetical protein